MSATNLPALLRFLTQDAKVPLATAMSKVKALQAADLASPENLSKATLPGILEIFPADDDGEKVAKQVLSAAKRVTKKKRGAGDEKDENASPRKKKTKTEPSGNKDGEDLEASLALPTTSDTVADLMETTLITNRAPLVLAFVLTLLKYTMPAQPLSSRLSLAMGYMGVTAGARAAQLGIERGPTAEEEGFGEGQPMVRILGKEIRVLRRWGGYEGDESGDAEPALWALDLDALRKNANNDYTGGGGGGGSHKSTTTTTTASAHLPIYTPQYALKYLLKSFNSAPTGEKRPSASVLKAQREQNLAKLLRCLDLVYASWAEQLTGEELDRRTWGWYVRVRPEVAAGAAGWGGRNELKLGEVLGLRRGGNEKGNEEVKQEVKEEGDGDG